MWLTCRWPAASITFVENHDTGSSQRHWPFPDDRLAVGYAYILTHPGLPCVFWEHYFPGSEQGQELRQSIDALMQVRSGAAGSMLRFLENACMKQRWFRTAKRLTCSVDQIWAITKS
jgi:hypothetical protein